jgi:hypothetical protein
MRPKTYIFKFIFERNTRIWGVAKPQENNQKVNKDN